MSDINFTSMVPELSRSADHLCQAEHQQNNEMDTPAGIENANNSSYYKGPKLKTPDYGRRGYVEPEDPFACAKDLILFQ